MSLFFPTTIPSYDLTLRLGSDLQLDMALSDADGVPLDLTGLTGRAQVVSDFGGTVLLTLAVAITSPSAGVFRWSATKAAIAGIPAPARLTTGRRRYPICQWDLELTDGSQVARVLEGTVNWSREATTVGG